MDLWRTIPKVIISSFSCDILQLLEHEVATKLKSPKDLIMIRVLKRSYCSSFRLASIESYQSQGNNRVLLRKEYN